MNAVLPSAIASIDQLEQAMSRAGSFADWYGLAQQHDQLSGAQQWREMPGSTLYDYNEIRTRYEKLTRCLEKGAARELLYALNEGVHGNMGGMGKPVLYGRARCGTKQLIEDYVARIAESLDYISKVPDSEISRAEKLDFFRRASHCYGRSALLLSGGAGLIYFHHGMVQELIDQDLLPTVISGSSAGSIVSAQLGIYTDEELRSDYFRRKRYVETTRTRLRDVFLGRVDPEDAKISREKSLDEIIPRDLTFQEAYERTGRYINISISPAEKHQSSRLMNAITSPNVYIRSAVSASCSIPGLIPAERLYAKGFDGKPRPYLETRRWVDGSVSGDLPAKRLSRLYGVNHFIVSLINPVVVPFIEDTRARQRKGLKSALSVSSVRMAGEILLMAERLLDRKGELGTALASQISYLASMLEQNYLGDINVLLEKKDFKWRQTLFEFRDGEIEDLIAAGMRRTWPKIAMIRNAALISKTLDRILEELNASEHQDGKRHHVYA